MTLQAFVSYAHHDWKTDQPVLERMLQQITRTAVSAHGERWLEIWRDEQLHWGEEWNFRLHEVLDGSHLLFVLLSPSWLKSDYCRKELWAFLQREKRLGGRRIFVAQIWGIDDSGADITTEMRSALAVLRTRQIKDWHWLLDADDKTQTREYRAAGKDLADWLHSWTPAQPAAGGTRPEPLPVVSDGPLVSGFFHAPSQGKVDGNPGVILDLAFAGLCEVKTTRGRFVFGVNSAKLQVSANAGHLHRHPDFDTTRCAAQVTRIESGKRKHRYNIVGRDQPLYGQVLAPPDAPDSVPLVVVERRGAASVTITGKVDIDAACIRIDLERSDPLQNSDIDPAKLQAMYRAVAEAIVNETPRSFKLEKETV